MVKVVQLFQAMGIEVSSCKLGRIPSMVFLSSKNKKENKLDEFEEKTVGATVLCSAGGVSHANVVAFSDGAKER